MNINGKYFSTPPKDGGDFKQLLKFAADAGVGLPVGDDGYPVGAWTPQLLANAISNIEANKKGVDLRSVQHWFEDNGKGPGPENINWLARVFGCDDTDKTAQWRAEISASYRRLALKRRSGRGAVEERPIEAPNHPNANPELKGSETHATQAAINFAATKGPAQTPEQARERTQQKDRSR